jgi:hypothetical protein
MKKTLPLTGLGAPMLAGCATDGPVPMSVGGRWRQCAATGHRRESARRPAALGSSSWATSAGSSVSLLLSLLSGKRRVHECQHRRLLLLV